MSNYVKLVREDGYRAEFEEESGERFILTSGVGQATRAEGYGPDVSQKLYQLGATAETWVTHRYVTPAGIPTRDQWGQMLGLFGYALKQRKEVFVSPAEVSEDTGIDSEGRWYDIADPRYEFVLKDTIPVKAVFGHSQNGHVYKTPDGDWLMVWPGADGKIRFRRSGSYSALIWPYVTPKGNQYKEVTLPGHLENEEVLLSQGYHVVSSEEKVDDPWEAEPACLRDFIQSMYQEACEEEANLKALGLDPEKDKELIANLKEQIAKAPPGSTILIITR